MKIKGGSMQINRIISVAKSELGNLFALAEGFTNTALGFAQGYQKPELIKESTANLATLQELWSSVIAETVSEEEKAEIQKRVTDILNRSSDVMKEMPAGEVPTPPED